MSETLSYATNIENTEPHYHFQGILRAILKQGGDAMNVLLKGGNTVGHHVRSEIQSRALLHHRRHERA